MIQIDSPELNDSIDEASALNQSPASGSLHTADDVDVYVVSIPENVEVNIGLTVTSGSATVSLLDSSGTAVETSSATGEAGTTSITQDRPAAGVYYLQVASVEGLVENYNLSFEALIHPTIPGDLSVNVGISGEITVTWERSAWGHLLRCRIFL